MGKKLPIKNPSEHCKVLRTKFQELVAERKTTGLSKAQKNRLDGQIKAVGDAIKDDCSDSRIRPSEDR
ncbi:MAG TPA: hypothetical protein VG269_15875 [Tepidisphaeraceae bacterium]|jgi:hypothetical protein|nr:hypothetical protein [Tepidisphaeraceae bacterium]